jgi:hypothetical protein
MRAAVVERKRAEPEKRDSAANAELRGYASREKVYYAAE